MRIGLVCPYDVDVHGGVQRHVLELADELRELGDHVAVLAPGSREPTPDGLTSVGPGLPIPFNGTVGRVRMGPGSGRIVRAWVDEGDFDLLHVHEPFTPSVSAQALWAGSLPVVATFHTCQESPLALQVSSKTFFRRSASRIDGAIAVSQVARRTLAAYTDLEATIIPNGVRVGQIAQGRRRESDGTLRLLFVGRVNAPRKGLPILLDALPRIAEGAGGVELDVIGPGKPPKVRKRVRRHSEVRFHGVLDDETRNQMLRDADVFVAPNTHGESFGIILVEAMAAGTPIVASDLEAFLDVLDRGRYGTTFTQGDSEALADAVLATVNEADTTQRKAQDAAEASQRFDWSVVAGEVREVYERTLAGFTGHPETPKDGDDPVDALG